MNTGITEEKIKRINELFHKSKAEGLTKSEKKEQELLRKEYIASVRANLRGQLNQIDLINPDGSVTPLADQNKTKKN